MIGNLVRGVTLVVVLMLAGAAGCTAPVDDSEPVGSESVDEAAQALHVGQHFFRPKHGNWTSTSGLSCAAAADGIPETDTSGPCTITYVRDKCELKIIDGYWMCICACTVLGEQGCADTPLSDFGLTP